MFLLINLNGLDSGLDSNMMDFAITYYRFINNVHGVFVSSECLPLLSEYLRVNSIPFDIIRNRNDGGEAEIKFYVSADIYMQPSHHIELRVRSILNN